LINIDYQSILKEGLYMNKITPFLWFDHQALEAARFYISIFKDSKITSPTNYGEDFPGTQNSVTSVNFNIAGQELIAFNGGPSMTFSPAISLFVNCETQEEVDYYWDKLSTGGKIQQCGWLTDKFGVTWQIVPSILGELLGSPDKEKSKRVAEAMMGMIKLDIEKLKQA
jgi:predicted 3-demethylubiquinone-9 3-methyltransferase (glyoxalase superfamily)